jgi:hypothetical protein
MNPKVFIGSSVEGKFIAEALNANLEHEIRGRVWSNTFPAASITIDNLLKECNENNFSIFVFSPDDVVKMRDKSFYGARDNVIFESGLFMGTLGREQVFIVTPRNLADYHLLTDLSGVTTLTYDANRVKNPTDVRSALQAAATEISTAIKSSAWKKHQLNISARASTEPAATWKLKVHFDFINPLHEPLIIESLDFDLNSNLKIDSTKGADYYKKPKFLYSNAGTHIYHEQSIIQGKNPVLSSWMPIDPSIGFDKLEVAVKNKQIGVWKYRCAWLKDAMTTFQYEVTI